MEGTRPRHSACVRGSQPPPPSLLLGTDHSGTPGKSTLLCKCYFNINAKGSEPSTCHVEFPTHTALVVVPSEGRGLPHSVFKTTLLSSNSHTVHSLFPERTVQWHPAQFQGCVAAELVITLKGSPSPLLATPPTPSPRHPLSYCPFLGAPALGAASNGAVTAYVGLRDCSGREFSGHSKRHLTLRPTASAVW